MEWSKTIRFDESLDEIQRGELCAVARNAGATLSFGDAVAQTQRTYALLHGEGRVQPDDVKPLIPYAKWYGQSIIALAIEPLPLDALQPVLHAAGGPGRPQGVIACEAIGHVVVVELDPSLTLPPLLFALIDIELRRFHGSRRTTSLAPLPLEVLTKIAAGGLQAPEIAPDRVLEALLGLSYVD